MDFRGSNFKNFLEEHAPRPPWGSGPSGLKWLQVRGEILSVTPASELNDNPVLGS